MNGILETLNQASQSFTLEGVLKWYALISLFSTPTALAFIAYTFKKYPEAYSAVNKKVSDFIDGDDDKSSRKKKGRKEKPSAQDASKNKTDELARLPHSDMDEEEERLNIPQMILRVGDKYRCQLSDLDKQKLKSIDYVWDTDNPFVGNIDKETGIYTAQKVGKAFIECGSRRMRIYAVDVRPNNKQWFALRAMTELLTKADIANIKTANIFKRIKSLNGDNRKITYDSPEGQLTYQWNDEGTIQRILYRLNGSVDIDALVADMSEYMQEMPSPDNTDDGRYWYHKSSLDEDFGAIDFVAFIKPSQQNYIYLGASVCWRQGALENELKSNIQMILRSFENLIDKADLPVSLVATVESEGSGKDVHKENGEKENDDARRQAQRRSDNDGTPGLKRDKDTPIVTEEMLRNAEMPAPEEYNDNPELENEPVEEGMDADKAFDDFNEEGEEEYNRLNRKH